MTLTKSELALHLHTNLSMSKQISAELVDSMFEEIRKSLERGNHVKISGFGNFDLRDKEARPGRNPKTGEEKTIPPRRVVTFKVGQHLKSKLNEYQGK